MTKAPKIAKAEGLDIVGEMFGLKRVSRDGHEDLLELYIEDDGSWYFKMSFSVFWMADLLSVLSEAETRDNDE